MSGIAILQIQAGSKITRNKSSHRGGETLCLDRDTAGVMAEEMIDTSNHSGLGNLRPSSCELGVDNELARLVKDKRNPARAISAKLGNPVFFS
jgi:hypothetical protein